MTDQWDWDRIPTYADYHSDDLQHTDPDGEELKQRNFERVNDPRKPHLFFLAFQDERLRITMIRSGSNYDTLWAQGCAEAKNFGGFWSIFNANGKFVDGNVVAR